MIFSLSISIDRWLSRLAPVSADQYRRHLKNFREFLQEKGSKFAEMEYDKWIEYQRSDPYSYELLDQIQAFSMQVGATHAYRTKVMSALRSFWLHSRAPLPKDPSFRIRGDKPKTMGTLTIEEVRLMLAKFNPIYRAIFLSMFQSGMGEAELVYWSDHGLESTLEQLDDNVRYLRIDLPGRKKRRNIAPYFTIIGKDAIRSLRTYIEDHRPQVDCDAIFLTQFDSPMTIKGLYQYWLRQLRNLGLIPKVSPGRGTGVRYGKNVHELRDLFRTRWEKSPATGTTAEYLMGHIVDPLEYNRAHRDFNYVRSEYVKAERWLNILSDDPEVVPRVELDVLKVDLEQRNDAQQLEIQALKRRQEATEQLMRELLESDVGLKKRRDRDG